MTARRTIDRRALEPAHATPASRTELIVLRSTGASIVICPSTGANLGDGIFDLPFWLGAGGRWSIGSDNHVSRSAFGELQLLEYLQRLALRRRDVAAEAAEAQSTAQRCSRARCKAEVPPVG